MAHRRRKAAVADGAHVGAAVGQAEHGVRIGQHGPHGLQVAVRVVEERHIEKALTTVGQGRVVDELFGGDAGARRLGGDARLRGRFVVGWVGEAKDLIPGEQRRP